MEFPVLIVAAHPDDVELGLGAAVSRWEGEAVYVYIASHGGYSGTDGQVKRENETGRSEGMKGLGRLGVPDDRVFFGDFETRGIEFGGALVSQIETIIDLVKPLAVICPWSGDHHQDHRAVHRAAIAAARRLPNVFGFFCTMTAFGSPESFTPTRFVRVSREDVERKLEACRVHAGEWAKYNKDGQAESFVRAKARFFGAACGTEFAEGLEVIRETT